MPNMSLYQTIANMSLYQTIANMPNMSLYQLISTMPTQPNMSLYETIANLNTTLLNYTTTANMPNMNNYLQKAGDIMTGTLNVYQKINIYSESVGDGYTVLELHNNTNANGHVHINMIGRCTDSNDGWSFDGRNVIKFQTKLLQNGTIYNRFAIQCMETAYAHLGILSYNYSGPIVQWDINANCEMSNNLKINGNVQNGQIQMNNTNISNNIVIGSSNLWDHTACLSIQNNSTLYGRSQIILVGRADLNNPADINSGINDFWSAGDCRNGIIFKTQSHYNSDTMVHILVLHVAASIMVHYLYTILIKMEI